MDFVGHESDSSHLVKVTLLHSTYAKIILNRSTLGYEIYFGQKNLMNLAIGYYYINNWLLLY